MHLKQKYQLKFYKKFVLKFFENFQSYAHPVLGIISTLFATLQIIGSFLRPFPGSSRRWIFDWIHWLGGNMAHILACNSIIFPFEKIS
jgi:hypothetical protein